MAKLLAFSPAVTIVEAEGFRTSAMADNLRNLRDNGTEGKDSLILTADALGNHGTLTASYVRTWIARFNDDAKAAGEPQMHLLAFAVEGVKGSVRVTKVSAKVFAEKCAAIRKASIA